MANIILINPRFQSAKGVTWALIMPPLGLGYLAAILLKKNHRVQILDANLFHISPEEIIDHFSFKPDLIGISASIVSYQEGIKYAKKIKASFPNTPLIFGGPHCSSCAPNILIKNPSIDAVVVGEGEYTLLEIAESIGKKVIFADIKGVVYRVNGQIVLNEPRPLVENPDTLPMPAYHLFPPFKNYLTRSRAEPVGSVLTSRGCPSLCTFCSRSFGKTWRPHSSDRVVEEVSLLMKTYGVKQIDILDENFTFDMKRAEEICDKLIQKCPGIKINPQIGIRLDKVTEGLLLKMKRAGFFKVSFGIESGDLEILKNVRKGIPLEKALVLTRFARSLGLVTQGYFMFGLPGETRATMQKTIDFSLAMNPHYASYSVFTPLPGTELFEDLKKKGHLIEEPEDGVDSGYFLPKVRFKTDSLESEEIVAHYKMAWRKFYLRPEKIIDVLSTVRSRGELRWLLRTIKDISRSKN